MHFLIDFNKKSLTNELTSIPILNNLHRSKYCHEGQVIVLEMNINGYNFSQPLTVARNGIVKTEIKDNMNEPISVILNESAKVYHFPSPNTC